MIHNIKNKNKLNRDVVITNCMFYGIVMIANSLNEKILTYILAHNFKSNSVKLYLLESNLVKSIP